MIYESVTLSPTPATLTAYAFTAHGDCHAPLRRAVVICPGGGYRFLSDREAEPIAEYFLGAGLNVFILRYTVGEGARDYAPLIQASLAIKYIREHAEYFHIDPRYVYTCGFSAGGHLAGWAGTQWNLPLLKPYLGDAPEGINRPTGMILSYPVISAGAMAHRGSFNHLLGRATDGTEPELDAFSLEKQVGPHTCPAFIWHTFTDGTVPVQNSLLMAEAMTAAGVPFELHIYPEGPHGLARANEETCNGKPDHNNPHLQDWIELAVRWIKDFNYGE